MKNDSDALLLRIFISSTDLHKNGLLYETIVFRAKEMGIAGATVFKGVLGYGASSVIHSYKFWEITDKVPVVIEIIDTEEKIRSFFNDIKPLLQSSRYGCLALTERAGILLYKSGDRKLNIL